MDAMAATIMLKKVRKPLSLSYEPRHMFGVIHNKIKNLFDFLTPLKYTIQLKFGNILLLSQDIVSFSTRLWGEQGDWGSGVAPSYIQFHFRPTMKTFAKRGLILITTYGSPIFGIWGLIIWPI